MRLDFEKESAHQARKTPGANQANPDAHEHCEQCASENRHQDRRGLSAQGHSDPDLLGSLAHDITHHAINPHTRNAQTEDPEEREQIDVTTYGRQRDKLREELTLAKIDHHAEAVDELDVEGILAFAERILPRASDLWVQSSLDYKQRLQQLFFPEGIAYDGNRFNRTAVTAPLFKYLAPSESADERVVSRLGIEPRTRRLRVCCSAN